MDGLEQKLRAKMALLESQMDFMESDMTHLDDMLKECGFPEGLKTLKTSVEEFISTMSPKRDEPRL